MTSELAVTALRPSGGLSPMAASDADRQFAVALARAVDDSDPSHSADGAAHTGSTGESITFGEMVTLLAERGEPFRPPASSPAALTGAASPSSGAASATTAASGPAPANVPEAAWAHPAVRAASQYLGTPYLWGGTDPAVGLDCSGFLQRAFADVGVSLPRVSADQSRAGRAVEGGLDRAQPGDLVYWSGRGNGPNHIGLYLGDGQMMHAPRRGDVVKVSPVRSAPPDAIRRVV